MSSFRSLLSGPNAFFNIDYTAITQRDFASPNIGPPIYTYTWNSESKIQHLAHKIISITFFPILGYNMLHNYVGTFVVPAVTPERLFRTMEEIDWARATIPTDTEWKYKRLTFEVDGTNIDAAIIGKEDTLANGIWTVVSGGNGEFYEDSLSAGSTLKSLLSKIQSNAIVFNYPGVGASEGVPNRQAMAKTYQAILCFLEKEMGAKKIICYGHSIGAGVQSDAQDAHALQSPDQVEYIFIKSRTFSSLSKGISCIFSEKLGSHYGPLMGIALHVLGWNMQPYKISKTRSAKEIILQTANVAQCSILSTPTKLIDDTIIPANATLAKALLDHAGCQQKHTMILGIPEHHNKDLSETTLSFLAEVINHSS